MSQRLIRDPQFADLTRCQNLSIQTDSELIQTNKVNADVDTSFLNKNLENNYYDQEQADLSFYQKLNSPVTSSRPVSPNDGSLVIAICLTALFTCLISVGVTCLFINKRYKMADYLSRHLSTTISSGQSNRSSASSTTSYNHYNAKNYLPSSSDKKDKHKYEKCQNFYEKSLKPMLDASILKPILNARYNLASETPTITTTISSSVNCDQHSPDSSANLTPPVNFKSMNGTLSSSNESCLFEAPSLTDVNQNNCGKFSKCSYSSPMSAHKINSHLIANIEHINITTNLLSPKLELSEHQLGV